MDKEIVLAQINDIFIDVLNDKSIILTDGTTARDIEGWDSLNHIQLVVAIERAFKIRFTYKEIINWENVGAIIDSILKK